MKVAILAGGVGSRLSEETVVKPKPMVEIGGLPILWHIMKIYAHYGYKDFAVALGYKSEYIKKYFIDYCNLSGSLSINMATGEVQSINEESPEKRVLDLNLDWNINLIDTGVGTNTGGRIKRLAPYVDKQTFMLTWGDGVADIDINALLKFHRSHGKLATVTAVRPIARFGHIAMQGDQVLEFSEKPQTQEGWINGAFFVLEPAVFDYIGGDDTAWDYEPMVQLARDGQLMAYKHTSFWQCMDTLREKKLLEELWESGKAPWKIWS